MKGMMPGLLGWLEAGCGKPLIGLATGLAELDERTCGLRGVVVLGAMPNSGKSALAVTIAVGVARHVANNGAAVVFVSLDMGAVEIGVRILSHTSGVDWVTLRRGSPKCRDRPHGPVYDTVDAPKVEAAKTELNGALGDRLTVLGAKDLPGVIDAPRLVALLEEAKAAAGVSRGLLILDYLGLIPVPAAVQKAGDLECDKFRIAMMQQVVERTRSPSNPAGDTVFVVAEVRKPPDAKTHWGGQLADLMGSARTAYSADAVLQFRRPTTAEVRRTYGLGAASKDAVDKYLASLDAQGVAPMIVSLAKVRDGGTRGAMAMEFLYRISTWRQTPVCLVPAATGGMFAGADDDDEDGLDGPGGPPGPPHGSNGQNAHLVARARLLEALAAAPDGETVAQLAQAAKLAAGPARQILEGLVAEGRAVAVPVTKPHGKGGKGAKTHPGFRLAGVDGQPEGASPATSAAPMITPTESGTPATCQG
jgi:hypothetical protein